MGSVAGLSLLLLLGLTRGYTECRGWDGLGLPGGCLALSLCGQPELPHHLTVSRQRPGEGSSVTRPSMCLQTSLCSCHASVVPLTNPSPVTKPRTTHGWNTRRQGVWGPLYLPQLGQSRLEIWDCVPDSFCQTSVFMLPTCFPGQSFFP